MKNSIKYLALSFVLLLFTGCAQQAPTQQPVLQQPVVQQQPTPQTTSTIPAVTQEQAAATSAQNQQTVTILNYAFDPATAPVKAGTKVTWVNNDPVPHKIVADGNATDVSAPAFGSDDLAQGASYSYTFATAGTFNYHCQIHPSMKGMITVTP